VNDIIKTYAKMFFVKVEQLSIQNDHIHILIRTHRRSHFHHFFRVVSGQIAQRFEKTGLLAVTDTPANRRKGTSLWKHRPFSRVVKGRKAFVTARNYVRLNEMEAIGRIPYRKSRLRGLSAGEWRILWG
jgi:putative transposase